MITASVRRGPEIAKKAIRTRQPESRASRRVRRATWESRPQRRHLTTLLSFLGIRSANDSLGFPPQCGQRSPGGALVVFIGDAQFVFELA